MLLQSLKQSIAQENQKEMNKELSGMFSGSNTLNTNNGVFPLVKENSNNNRPESSKTVETRSRTISSSNSNSNSNNYKYVLSNSNNNTEYENPIFTQFDPKGWRLNVWTKQTKRGVSDNNYKNIIDPMVKELAKEGIKQNRIRTELHHYGRTHDTRYTGLQTKNLRNASFHTKEDIIKVLENLLTKTKRKKSKTNKNTSTYPVNNTPTPTASNVYTRKNLLSFPKHQQASTKPKQISERFLGNQGRTNINTSSYKIPNSIFRTTVQTNFILRKIYNAIKPQLIQRKLYDKSKRKLLSDFIYHFIHQQSVQIHPKGLTGEMIEVVIEDPQDLYNFLCLQQKDMQHDFGKNRIKIDTVNNIKNNNSPNVKKEKENKKASISVKKQGIDRIKQYVDQDIKEFVKSIKSNIEFMNPGKGGKINKMFEDMDANIGSCYVATKLKGLKEQDVFDTLTTETNSNIVQKIKILYRYYKQKNTPKMLRLGAGHGRGRGWVA